MDKNSAIGFGLLMLLLIAYVFINQNNQAPKANANKTSQGAKDSINTPSKSTDTIQALASAPVLDSTIAVEEQVLENEDVKITFINQGAYPSKIYLKKYKTFDKKALILFEGQQNYFDFVYAQNGQKVHTKNKRFKTQIAENGRFITFSESDDPNAFKISYNLPEKGYMMDMKVNTGTSDASQDINLEWNGQSLHTEQDKVNEKLYTQVCYNLKKDGYDYFTITEEKKEDYENQSIKWLSFKQHFFNTTLVPEAGFLSGVTKTAPVSDSLTQLVSNFNAVLTLKHSPQLNFQYYTGPNDYEVLKSYKHGMEEIIPLSYGIFGFVKYINKWLIIPIFKWLASIFSNYGIVIILLTLIIRLLMSPFTYKSYVSSAKMKALKPELDELKAKLGDDKQAYGVEQMKLYKQAGVNPLGGCLPALLQLPVFFALFSYFPHAIDLRQKGFLWATDLSTYDTIVNLPFNIPFYGTHVSLFTILFCITSLLLALYSMNTATMDQNNPMLKYMPFIMPVMFLGIFNKLAASLTLYYFISNLVTMGIQFVIQKWIIDPDKIRASILAKKNEPPKESNFMKKMQELQEQNSQRQNQTRSQRRK